MSIDRTRVVAVRVLRQIAHDHRSLIMVTVMPLFLLWVLKLAFEGVPGAFERIGPMLLGTFPFVMMFLVTSIVMLRERNQGTLDRLMVSPIGRGDIMFGYAIAFLVVAAIQSAMTLTLAVSGLGVPMNGAVWQALVLVFALGLYGVALGLGSSAFASTEFQAVQFMPLLILPQIFLAGLIVPVTQMSPWLEWIARIIPLQYSFRAMTDVMVAGKSMFTLDGAITLLVPAIVLGLGTMTLRRSSRH